MDMPATIHEITLPEYLLREFSRHYRPEKERGAVAEAYVEFLLSNSRGEVIQEPEIDGRKPDLAWRVAPEIESSFVFVVEVAYGHNTEQAIKALKEKSEKYEWQLPMVPIVALVYDDDVDIQQIIDNCGPRLAIDMMISPEGITTEPRRIEQGPFGYGFAHCFWLIPYPPSEYPPLHFNVQSQVVEVYSENVLHKLTFNFGYILNQGFASEESPS